MGASINNQTKTQNLHKKQNVQKIKKKKRFKTQPPSPLKTPTLSRRTLKIPSFCDFMTFVHQLQLLRPPFAAWVSAVLLELRPGIRQPELWPGHDMVEGVASLKKTLNSSPLKIIRPLGNLGDSELGISESFLGWAN